MKYRGYTITRSGMNYYVQNPRGERLFAEIPASVKTAKEWIDMVLAEMDAAAWRKHKCDTAKEPVED